MPLSVAQYQNQVLLDIGDRGASAVFELVFPVESTGGTWTFGFGGALTAALNRFITPAALQTALCALPTIGAANLKARLGLRGFVLEFCGALLSQELPLPTPDGALLQTTGAITVLVRQDGSSPVFGGDVSQQWNRNSDIIDTQLRFLKTRVDVMREYLGVLQMQVDQKTGDVQRSFSQQFKQAQASMAAFERELSIYAPRVSLGTVQVTALLTQPTAVTPNGAAYGVMVGGGRGGLR